MPPCNTCCVEGAEKGCVCGRASYCGAECQKKDWKRHKANCPPFFVKKIEGKGNGLIALRKISLGDKILSEKPLLVIENVKSDNFDDWCDHVTGQVNAMGDDNLKVYKNLADNESFQKTPEFIYLKFKKGFTEDNLKHLRILRTNGINTDEQGKSTCVFSTFSLLNHSCAPNAMRNVEDEESGEIKVTAARDIAKGEEITIKYFSEEIAALKREKRRQKLLNWGFLCSCEVCSLDGEELKKNEETREALEAAKNELKLCPTDPTDILSLQNQRKLELSIISLLRHLSTQLVAEMPDHLMACHHVLKLLVHHRQKVSENPEKFRKEALELSQKLGSKFVAEFKFWDNLTTRTMNSFQRRKKK